MKKIFALIMALALSLSLFACAGDDEKKNDDLPSENNGQQTNVPEEPEQPEEPKAPEFTEETFPKLDGSTATIPLSEGIVKALLAYAASDAQEFVHHNTTHNAYVNLIDGKCDLIFVTPPSEDEYAMMDDSGREFTVRQVVKDAFVFLVNKNNPVDNIALEDLQKIYKGEITNWKELGGNDAPITPFQRPDNSGSQTLMYKLVVSKDEIMDAPTELRPGGMDDLVDAVSSYDEGLDSIGYSVFYYASGMYTDPNSKLISIDGFYPTAETIADGSYPLTDGYYAVYDASLTEDSGVLQLLEWLDSDTGQKTAANEGYVPMRILTE